MIKGPTTLVANYCPQYKAGPTGAIILDNQFHPLYFLTKRKYQLRERTGLWWHGLAGLTVSSRRVVRNWCARRLRNAFKDALKLRGFDEHGRVRIEPGSTDEPPAIGGYLRLQGTWRTPTADNDMLRNDCLKVLDEIIKSCNYSPAVGNRRSNHLATRSRLGLKGT